MRSCPGHPICCGNYCGNPWRFDGADSASNHKGFRNFLAERGGHANGLVKIMPGTANAVAAQGFGKSSLHHACTRLPILA
jgi:hypothetical protein